MQVGCGQVEGYENTPNWEKRDNLLRCQVCLRLADKIVHPIESRLQNLALMAVGWLVDPQTTRLVC